MPKLFSEIPQQLPPTQLLSKVNYPKDLKNFNSNELLQLADEVREFLLYTVAKTGGHFGAGLGVVELTIALHYVFNTPEDKLVWDVGHQTYPHKILTGRRKKFDSLRQKDGLSGFPKRSESQYDHFGVGHSSTSISAASGMAIAAELMGRSNRHVAIIGDGALTAGMAFEALNHAASRKTSLLVILNDNQMSISKNVGALSNYFNRILASKFYNKIRERSKKNLIQLPILSKFFSKVEEFIKGINSDPGLIFEEMGFNYIGPIDGHDLKFVVKILEDIKDLQGPVFLHCITEKGHGYQPAMHDPIKFHALSKTKPLLQEATTQAAKPKPAKPKFQDVFGQWLCAAAAKDKKIVAVTPAMTEGSGMVKFAEKFPDRFVDVGIAEQHSVTYSAGIACEGYKAVCAIYSTFLQRGYDQLIHDVAIQNLDVLFALDRAGLVGEDGATHAGNLDNSFLRCIPNMVVMCPSDEAETCSLLSTGLAYKGPSSVRYPRGSGIGVAFDVDAKPIAIGKANIVKTSKSNNIAILAFGTLLHNCTQSADAFDCTLVDMRFVKPIDQQLVTAIASSHNHIITVEENVIAGGAGSGVAEFLNTINHNIKIHHLGLPDAFQDHASKDQQLQEVGLDSKSIYNFVNEKSK